MTSTILKRYAMKGAKLTFKELFNIAKVKGMTNDEEIFEMDLENELDNEIIKCERINNNNNNYFKC